MVNIVPVDRERHAGKGWRQPTNYAFAATEAAVPLVGTEFARAAIAMPIAFIEQAGRYLPAAVTSPMQGRNLFVGPSGQWLGGYVPERLRSYRFFLMRVEGSDKMALGIDQDSGLIVDADADTAKFFEEDGSPSVALKAALEFLQKSEDNRLRTDLVIAALAEAGVIQPWQLTVVGDDQKQLTVSGLYRIETKLNALDNEAFLKLRQSTALMLAYSQLISMQTLGVFAQLAAFQRQLAPRTERQNSPDEIFAAAHSEAIRFN